MGCYFSVGKVNFSLLIVKKGNHDSGRYENRME